MTNTESADKRVACIAGGRKGECEVCHREGVMAVVFFMDDTTELRCSDHVSGGK